MKTITNELRAKLIKSNGGLAKVKWDEIFDNEQELIEAMFNECETKVIDFRTGKVVDLEDL